MISRKIQSHVSRNSTVRQRNALQNALKNRRQTHKYLVSGHQRKKKNSTVDKRKTLQNALNNRLRRRSHATNEDADEHLGDGRTPYKTPSLEVFAYRRPYHSTHRKKYESAD